MSSKTGTSNTNGKSTADAAASGTVAAAIATDAKRDEVAVVGAAPSAPTTSTTNSKYAIVDDAPLTSGRHGARLSKFPLDDMKVGQSFVIPNIPRVIKGKQVLSPEEGINIKAANTQLSPKKFVKLKIKPGDKQYPNGGLRIGRVADVVAG